MTANRNAEEPAKKLKSVDLEDILASGGDTSDAQVTSTNDMPIYDRLNEFLGASTAKLDKLVAPVSPGTRVAMDTEVENVYDVDLELISQIIRTQEQEEALHDSVLLTSDAAADLFGDLVMDVDVVNGNNTVFEPVEQKTVVAFENEGVQDVQKQVIQEQQAQSTPPTRPPKSPKAPPPPPPTSTVNAPPLPPKKSPATTPTKSPTKSSPAAFLKNLFSPTKNKKNANTTQNANVTTQQPATTQQTAQQVPPDNVSTTTSEHTLVGNYELTEQLGLYVDNEAPLATASEFGDYGDTDLIVTGGGNGTAAAQDSSQTYYCSVNNNRVNNN